MRVAMIVAVSREGLIGTNGALPWRLSSDLRRFKSITMGKPVIMGRKTYESIGRPLPGRFNIVLTRDRAWSATGVHVVHTPAEAETAAEQELRVTRQEEALVIGGAQLYRDFAERTGRLYLTVVEGAFTGDTYFPLDRFQDTTWTCVVREWHPASDKDLHPHYFLVLDRVVHPAAGPCGDRVPCVSLNEVLTRDV